MQHADKLKEQVDFKNRPTTHSSFANNQQRNKIMNPWGKNISCREE